MTKRRGKDDTEEIIQRLESRGYKVRKDVNYVKKTFDINKDLLSEATQLRQHRNVTLREMFSQALVLWINTHKSKE